MSMQLFGSITSFLSSVAAPIGFKLLLQTAFLLALGLLSLAIVRHRRPQLQTFLCHASFIGVALSVSPAFIVAGNVRPVVNVNMPAAQHWVSIPMSSRPAPLPAPPPQNSRPSGAIESRSGAGTSQVSPVDSSEEPQAALQSTPETLASSIQIDLVWMSYQVGLVLWIVVALALLSWLGLCHFYILRLRLTSEEVTDGEAFDLLHQLCKQHGVLQPVLLANSSVSSPLLCGLWKPAFLLPATYEYDYDTASMRAVLLHELAHGQRRDLRWNLFSRILCALLWPQPLMWALHRRMEEVSEEACDRAVIDGGCSPKEYASVLVSLAERLSPKRAERAVGAGVVPSRSALGRRVQEILAAKHRATRVSWRARAAVACAVIALAVVASLSISVRAIPQSQLDLSSPEETVRSFIRALNSKDMEKVAQCVNGALPAESLKGLPKVLEQSKQAWIIDSLYIKRDAEGALVTLNSKFETENLASSKLQYRETSVLRLRQIDRYWKIIPTEHSNLALAQQGKLPWVISCIAGVGLDKIQAWAKAQGTARVAGRARWDDGRPAANIKLSLAVQGNFLWKQPELKTLVWHMSFGTLPEDTSSMIQRVVTTDAKGGFHATGLGRAPYIITSTQRYNEKPQDWVLVKDQTITLGRGTTVVAPDVILTRGAMVQSQVVAADTGKPLAGVMVSTRSLHNSRDQSSHRAAVTDKDGRAELRVAPGDLNLTLGFNHVDGARGMYISSSGANYSPRNWIVLVDGKVVKSNSLLFRINVQKDQTRRVTLRLPRFQPQPTPTPLPTPDPRKQPRGNGVITGRVISEDGKPAAGVVVRAQMQQKAQWQLWQTVGLASGVFNREPYASRWEKVRGMVKTQATTDDNGVYHLTGLTTAPYNLFIAVKSDKGGTYKAPPQGQGVAAAVEGVWAKADQTIQRTQPLVLTRGVRIHGKVIDKATRQPLGGVLIGYNGPQLPGSTDNALFTKSDEKGRFTLNVTPGTTSLYIGGPAINNTNYVFADTKKSAEGVYRIRTNQGAYAGSEKVEYSIDEGPLQYGLGFNERIDIAVKSGQERAISLHLRKIIEDKTKSDINLQ